MGSLGDELGARRIKSGSSGRKESNLTDNVPCACSKSKQRSLTPSTEALVIKGTFFFPKTTTNLKYQRDPVHLKVELHLGLLMRHVHNLARG